MTLKVDGTNGVLQAYDYQVLTTGFSYTFSAGTQTLIANPAGTLATGTITMPSSAVDGMVITFISTQQITALTINGNTGQTVVSKPALLYANQALTYVYRLANTTWYPMVSQVAPSAGPAFSAYLSTNQTPTAAVLTKIQFNTEEFDTNSNYDNATNYRFTPTVAGYYQVSAFLYSSGGGGQYISIYKNGSEFKRGTGMGLPSGSLGSQSGQNVSALIYCNGSTDYVEVYGYNSAGGVFTSGVGGCYFQAAMVRGA